MDALSFQVGQLRKAYKDFPVEKPSPLFPDRLRWEPILQVRLGYKHAQSARIFAFVDSGSPYTLFKYDAAALVGLEPTKDPVFTDEIGGIISGPRESVYFHKVSLYFEAGWRIEVTAGFVKKLGCSGILGRNGFFDNFKVTFDHSTIPPAFELERISRT
jgi:hypothetical protein